MSPITCPDVRSLQSLLEEGGEPGDLIFHLETCAGCQHTLEVLTAEPSIWEDAAEGLVDRAREEPALQELVARLKGEDPQPAEDLCFLQPSDKPGLLGLLGQYEVLEEIGRGGMGVVLKALDPALNRLVAVKVVSPYLASSATARRRFVREARAAAAVCHEHVVTVHGVHEADGLPYLVMQYVEGESLQARLDRVGPLEVVEIVRIGMQTASGLAAAHAQGLIHRDIKPANLLLENGLARVKITDFGLARMIDDVALTQNGMVAGTPEYMAPEQARGETIDHRADLFSLGSVLYALCTGRPPFRGSTALGVLRRVSDETPTAIRELNPDVPALLEALIDRLMAKGPGERFQSAAEVAALLEGYLAHLRQPATVPAPELPAGGPPRRSGNGKWGRRRICWAGGVLAAILLAGVGLGTASWLAEPEDMPPADMKARFHQDLRKVDPDTPMLRLTGEGVRFEPAGVRITLPHGQNSWGAGVTTTFHIHGDFEITTSFEVLKAERPTTGFGAGVSLYAAIDEKANDAVSLARRIFTDGSIVFISNRMTPGNRGLQHRTKTQPSNSVAGKLRIQRVGSKVRFFVADGEKGEFTQVDEAPFGRADIRYLQIGGNTGGAKSGLDVRLLDLTIRAEALPGAAETAAVAPDALSGAAADTLPTEGTGWGTAAVLLVLATVLAGVGLGVWISRRPRRSTDTEENATGPGKAAPTVSFACATCGKNLKAKAQLAGKKVKCISCGRAALVPSLQAGEPSRDSV